MDITEGRTRLNFNDTKNAYTDDLMLLEVCTGIIGAIDVAEL
jgi:hypothetical protein